MIDIKELRIGDVVKIIDVGYGSFLTISDLNLANLPEDQDSVTGIMHDNIFDCDNLNINYNSLLCSEIEPIKLTSEILLKLGFKKKICEIKYEPYKVTLYNLNTLVEDIWVNIFISESLYLYYEEYDDCRDSMYYDTSNRKIEYLHQLRNLYYALTGHELETKKIYGNP